MCVDWNGFFFIVCFVFEDFIYFWVWVFNFIYIEYIYYELNIIVLFVFNYFFRKYIVRF